MSSDQYTPTEDEVRHVWAAWSEYGGLTARTDDAPPTEDERLAEADRFLARVKRDAARAALDGLVTNYLSLGTRQFPASVIASQIAYRADTHYPEEDTP